jgi:hypothetical protein
VDEPSPVRTGPRDRISSQLSQANWRGWTVSFRQIAKRHGRDVTLLRKHRDNSLLMSAHIRHCQMGTQSTIEIVSG